MASTTAPTINTYISDMLSLEQHIATPLQEQIDDSDVQALPNALRVVRETLDTVNGHIESLQARLDAVGGHSGSPIKNAVATATGVAASALNKMRKTEVSKGLRDDYTALSLASAGYTMLHTTALGLNDAQTADLAREHLADVGTLIMRINSVLPSVVLAELQQEGANVMPAVAETAERDAESAWQEAGARSGAPA
jgi:ferritin-like metal-binding protein YciE